MKYNSTARGSLHAGFPTLATGDTEFAMAPQTALPSLILSSLTILLKER